MTALDRLRRFSLEPRLGRFYDGAGINGSGRGKTDSRDNLAQIGAAKLGRGGGVDGSGHGGSHNFAPSNTTLLSGSPGPLGPRPGKAIGRRGRGDLERSGGGDNGVVTAYSIRGEGTRAVGFSDSVSLEREELDCRKPQHIIMSRDISIPAHPSPLSPQGGAPRGGFGITDQDPIYYVPYGQVETICASASMDAEADSTRLFVGIGGSRGGGSGGNEGGRGDDRGQTQAGAAQLPALNLNMLRYAPPPYSLCCCI